MKNGFLIWNVILSIVVALLLFFQFGPKKKKGNKDNVSRNDTTEIKQFRLAYFEMDSLEANFDLVKDVKAEISAKDIEYNNNLNKLDQTYRNKYNEFADKPQMTQDEQEAASKVLNQLGESLKNQKLDLDQKYQDFVMRKNLEVKKKIEDYLKIYNQEKKYSYIMSFEQGLFYYKDSSYNITADVIRGLNEYYKLAKK